MICEQGQAWLYREEQRALGVVRLIGIGIIALIVACLLSMCSGCATYDRISKYVPASPITISSGGLDILHVLEINVGASLHNPFAESAKDTTVKPPVVDTPAPPVVDTFENPDCGPSLPDTHSEEFRWKYQHQEAGHAGNRYRVKIAWPSYAVHVLKATKANSVTRLYLPYLPGGVTNLPVYALDGGEKTWPAGTPADQKPARPNSEWFDPDTAEKNVRVELWIAGKLAMRTTVGNVAAQYQGPMQERINY